MPSPCLNLPYEVISLITSHLQYPSHLYQSALINKQFYAATVPQLYEEPCYSTYSSLLRCLLLAQQHQQSHALRSFPIGNYIRRLELSSNNSTATTFSLLSQTPFLEELCLCEANVSNDTMAYVGQLCPRLTDVYLSFMPLNHLNGLAHHCRQLTSLSLSRCEGLNSAALEPLLACPLTRLQLADCDWLTADETAHHISQLHLLEVLVIRKCELIDNHFVQRFLRPASQPSFFPRLKTLVIRSDSPGAFLTPEVVISWIQSLPLLESVTIHFATVTLATLAALTSSPLLHCVEVHSFSYDLSSSALRNLIRDRPQWTELQLIGCILSQRCFPETEKLYHSEGIMLEQPTLDRIRRNTDFYIDPKDDVPCQIDHYEYQHPEGTLGH